MLENSEYTIESKTFTILRDNHDFNILNYDGIDYISVDDAYEILTIMTQKKSKYILDSYEVSDIYDWNNNKINIEVTKVFSPARIIFSERPKNFDLSGIENIKNYRIEATSLNDFNVNYISVDNAIYLPLMILNYSVFDNEYLLYPSPDKKSFTIDEIYLYCNTNEEFINSIDLSGDDVLNESPTLRKFSAAYLHEFINKNYPYISLKKDALTDINLDTINTNDEYVHYVFESLFSLDDGHTVPREFRTPVFDSPTFLRTSNLYIRFKDYMKALEHNAQFTNSEYKIIENNLGYIRIHSFHNNDIFLKMPYIIKELTNTDGLIIDLRFNQGGSIQEIVSLLDSLVEKNDSIQVYYNQKINGELADIKNFEITKIGNLYYEKPVVLLINKFTYSAANMFAGLYKDNEVGTIIGEKTLGGGSNKIISVLPDGSSFYFSNPGMILLNRSGDYFETGIDPDIQVEDNLENGTDDILEFAIDYLSTP